MATPLKIMDEIESKWSDRRIRGYFKCQRKDWRELRDSMRPDVTRHRIALSVMDAMEVKWFDRRQNGYFHCYKDEWVNLRHIIE